MIGLLLACASPPEARYVDALAAPDFDAAWAICADVPARDRGDCQQTTVTRFGRFEACDQVEAGVWRQECLFTAAEARARAADRPGALTACAKSTFVANCEQHVLEAMAMEYLTATPAALDAAWAEVEPLTQGKNAKLDLWRSWHRMRIQRGMPFEKCTNKPCRTAMQLEVKRETLEVIHRSGCDPSALPWAPNSDASRWADEPFRQRCGAQAGPGGATLSGREAAPPAP